MISSHIRTVLVVSTLCLAISQAGACTFECTDEPCERPLLINFERNNAWDSGEWEISLKASEKRLGSCSIQLPVTAPPPDELCSGELALSIADGGRGVADVSSAHDFETDQTVQITLTVKKDGAVVSEQNLQPNFQSYRPNGPGCPPVCQRAEVEFSF